MNTKYFNWHTFKLVVIWFISIQMQEVRGLSLDEQYTSIMSATPFMAVGTILLFLGIACEWRHRGYWLATSVTLLLAFNIYSWLIPFPLALSLVEITGIVVINLATTTTLYQYITSASRMLSAEERS